MQELLKNRRIAFGPSRNTPFNSRLQYPLAGTRSTRFMDFPAFNALAFQKRTVELSPVKFGKRISWLFMHPTSKTHSFPDLTVCGLNGEQSKSTDDQFIGTPSISALRKRVSYVPCLILVTNRIEVVNSSNCNQGLSKATAV